jgi:hypothetical protein
MQSDIITLIREQIAKEIEAYAKTQEKTMQKAAYECVAIARGKVGKSNDCGKCGMDKENINYWETHQTMSDGNIWCANKKHLTSTTE